MDNDDRTEILFLALTRPSLRWGVPFEGLVINMCASFLAGVMFCQPVWYRPPMLYWAAFFPIHAAMRRITAWDFHGFRTLRLWMTSTGVGRVALAALPARRIKKSETIPSSV